MTSPSESEIEWPALEYESVAWDVHPATGAARRDLSMLGRPYRASLPAQIAHRSPVPSASAQGLAEEAAVALGAFDAEFGNSVAPFSSILLRSESASSSQIEQLTASARKVAEAEVNGSGTEHAVMIVGNVRAMEAALNRADELDADAVLAMHHALMSVSDPDIAGRLREDQVWIGGRSFMGAGSPHDADFVPPVAARVGQAMDDLMEFVARDDLAAVVQSAVAHAQFETIHPFDDGNGRTGRALLQAMLRSKGVTRSVSVPLSSGLLSDPGVYVTALTAYRSGDIDPIVECVARAALLGVEHARHLIGQLDAVRVRWDDALSDLRSDAAARRLATELFRHPVVTAPMARDLLGITGNEHRHLDALEKRGILMSSTDHKSRNRTWRATEVLDALDDYARLAGRRRRMSGK